MKLSLKAPKLIVPNKGQKLRLTNNLRKIVMKKNLKFYKMVNNRIKRYIIYIEEEK
jgi:hypothetical protein